MIPPHKKPANSLAVWLARLFWLIAAVQAGFCLALAFLNHLTFIRFFAEYIFAIVFATLGFATVGLLIVSFRPGHTVGWLFCAAGVGSGWIAWLQQYVRYTLVTHPGALPGGLLLSWLNFWLWLPVTAIFVIFLPLIFPTGQLPSRRWRPVVWTALIAIALLSLGAAISPGPGDASLPEVSNPFAPANAAQLLRVLNPLAFAFTLFSMAGAVAAPLARLRRASGAERRQLAWFAYAAALLMAALLIPVLIYWPHFTQSTLLSGILLTIAFPFLPTAVWIAILRYRLYDIDLLVNRTIVYAVLTLALAFIYFASVVLLQSLMRPVIGETNDLAIVISTLAIAALFTPLRRWIQSFIDRRFYRRKYHAEQVVAIFSSIVKQDVDIDRTTSALLNTVHESLQPADLSLWLIHRKTNYG